MLAPKDEEWNSLQSAVNLQTSRNFVIKKRTSLQYTLLHPEMERIESEIDKALNIFTDLAPP